MTAKTMTAEVDFETASWITLDLILHAENTGELYKLLEQTFRKAVEKKSVPNLRQFLSGAKSSYIKDVVDSEKIKHMTPAEDAEFITYFERAFETWKDENVMTTVNQVLKNCTVDGMIVRLPNVKLDRELYVDVKKQLELIGGKWTSGKTRGFVFAKNNPKDLLQHLIDDDGTNHKKEFQFFATPDELADELVELAEIKPNHTVLEPSAGQGALVEAIRRAHTKIFVNYYELMQINRTILQQKFGGSILVHSEGEDFLTCKSKFDRIIANPPFSKNSDITHIYKMYECLHKGGRLVSIASVHYQHASGKKETAFKNWLKEVGATVKPVEAGAFKESGTVVPTVIIVIDKK